MNRALRTAANLIRGGARFCASRSWRAHEFLVTAGFDETAIKGQDS